MVSGVQPKGEWTNILSVLEEEVKQWVTGRRRVLEIVKLEGGVRDKLWARKLVQGFKVHGLNQEHS